MRYPDGAYIDIEHHLLRLALVSEVTPRANKKYCLLPPSGQCRGEGGGGGDQQGGEEGERLDGEPCQLAVERRKEEKGAGGCGEPG